MVFSVRLYWIQGQLFPLLVSGFIWTTSQVQVQVQVQMHSMGDFLKVECAGGQLLPYLGYIEAEVSVPGLGLQGSQPLILLVVLDTDYNKRVSLLLGTNILQSLVDICKNEVGPKFMQQIAHVTPWWLAFGCINQENRAVTRSKGKLGLVKCATSETLRIPANTVGVVTGFVLDAVPGMILAMVHPTSKSILPEGVEVTPTLVSYTGQSSKVDVEISNTTNRPVLVQPRSLLCELQQVEVAKDTVDEDKETGNSKDKPIAQSGLEEEEEYLSMFNVEESLTPEQLARVHVLLFRYKDIFSTGDLYIGHTKTVRHRVDLTGEVPFKQRHRRIPPALYEEVKAHLQH